MAPLPFPRLGRRAVALPLAFLTVLVLPQCVFAVEHLTATPAAEAMATAVHPGTSEPTAAYHLNIIVNDFVADPAAAVAHLGPTFTNHVAALLRRLNVELTVNVTAVQPGGLPATADAADVVWTNPGAVAELMQKFNYTPIASMENVVLGEAESKFGGVFITHTGASAARITSEDDCARDPVRLATISRKGFGGFLMHFKHLLDRGAVTPAFIDNPGIVETGSQPLVVDMVNAGNVTCGFVRTHVLEALGAERTRNVRVLGRRTDSAAILFPFVVTTAFYPEWTVAVHPRVPAELQSLLQEALLTVRSNSAVAVTGGYSRFFPAVSHAAVLEMLWATGVLPRPPASPPPAQPLLPAWAVAVLAVAGTGVVFASGAAVRRALRRDPLAYAPSDAAEPFAVSFLAVKGLTSLRREDPEQAAALVAELRRVVREESREREVYEGPQTGDAVMVCGLSAAAVVETVMAVHARLQVDDWAAEANEVLCAFEICPRRAPRTSDSETSSSRSRHTHRSTRRRLAGNSSVAAIAPPVVALRAGVHFGFGSIDIDPDAVEAARGGDSVGGVPFRYTGPVVDVVAAATDAAQGGEVVVTVSARDAVLETGRRDFDMSVELEPAAGPGATNVPCYLVVHLADQPEKYRASSTVACRTAERIDAIDSVSAAAQAAAGAFIRKRVTAVAVHFDVARSCSGVQGPTQSEVEALLKALDEHVVNSGATLLAVAHDSATVCFNAHAPALDQVRQAAEFCETLPLIFGAHGVQRVTTGLATGTALVGQAALSLGDGCEGARPFSDVQMRPVVFGQCLADAAAAELAMRQAVAWNGGRPLGLCCGVPADHAEAGQLLSVMAIGPLECWRPPPHLVASADLRLVAVLLFSRGVNDPQRHDDDDGEWLFTVNDAAGASSPPAAGSATARLSQQIALINGIARRVLLCGSVESSAGSSHGAAGEQLPLASSVAVSPLTALCDAADDIGNGLHGTPVAPGLLEVTDALIHRALSEPKCAACLRRGRSALDAPSEGL